MSVLNKKEERARRWRYKLEHIFSCQNLHINSKPGNHTWVRGGKALFLLSSEKFVILNMREHKLMKSAERRDTDASKRTERDDIHKSKTVS